LKWWGVLCRAALPSRPLFGCLGNAARRADKREIWAVWSGGRGLPHSTIPATGRLTKARHSPRAALWQRVWRVLVPRVRLWGGRAPGLDQLPRWAAGRRAGRAWLPSPAREGDQVRRPTPGRVRGVAGSSANEDSLFFGQTRHRGTRGRGRYALAAVSLGGRFHPNPVLGNGGTGLAGRYPAISQMGSCQASRRRSACRCHGQRRRSDCCPVCSPTHPQC
jgi:hypothetical protein